MKIHSTLFPLLFFVLRVDFLFAQQWSFGLQSGLNYGSVTESIYGGNQKKTGFNLGLKINYDSSKKIFVSFNPSFSEKGAKSGTTFFDTLSNVILTKYYDVFKLNYIELPILLGYKLKLAKILKIYPFLGLHGGFLIKANFANANKAQVDFTKREIILHYDNLLKDGLKEGFIMHRWEYGYLLGLGMEFKLSNHFSLHLEAYRQQALSDFTDGINPIRFFYADSGLKNKLYAIKMALMYF